MQGELNLIGSVHRGRRAYTRTRDECQAQKTRNKQWPYKITRNWTHQVLNLNGNCVVALMLLVAQAKRTGWNMQCCLHNVRRKGHSASWHIRSRPLCSGAWVCVNCMHTQCYDYDGQSEWSNCIKIDGTSLAAHAQPCECSSAAPIDLLAYGMNENERRHRSAQKWKRKRPTLMVIGGREKCVCNRQRLAQLWKRATANGADNERISCEYTRNHSMNNNMFWLSMAWQ